MTKYLLIAAAAAVIGLWGSVLIVRYGSAQYDKGYAQAREDLNNAHDKAIEALRRTRKEVGGLSEFDLISRYCKWVWDIPYDDCVRTVNYVP